MALDKRTMVLRILDDQNRLSERADTKAISLLSTLGIFTVFFIAHFRDIPMDTFSITLLVIYFTAVLLSIIHIILAISPRIHTEKTVPLPGSDSPVRFAPTFFEGICKYRDATEYKQCLDSIANNEDSVTDTYADQIYTVAKINKTKYTFVKRSVWLVVTALMSQLTIIAYTFAYKS